MRIFKNRGDIFFSKTNKEKSTEQKILITALVVIVLFTVVFVFAVAARYDFSATKFFEPENLSTTQQTTQETAVLPEVSGKSNIVVTVADDGILLYAELIQVDMDNKSYKICTLKANTEYDGSTLKKIYKSSGVENVKTAIESLFSTEIDRYIDFESDDFAEYFSNMGTVNYALISDVKYKDSSLDVELNVKFKAGEQTLGGSDVIGLVRYYLDVENNTSIANDLLLTALSQQMNEENYVNRETLFQEFVTLANTDITIRDFSAAQDNINVLCNSLDGISVYNAELEYDKNTPDEKSLQEAKGYFVN